MRRRIKGSRISDPKSRVWSAIVLAPGRKGGLFGDGGADEVAELEDEGEGDGIEGAVAGDSGGGGSGGDDAGGADVHVSAARQ